MKRALLAAAALLLACPGKGPPRTYEANDLVLAVGNAARMTCSCVFVMEMPEDFCRAWVKASPDVAHFTVNRADKSVQADSFISWAAKAHYVDENVGCVLE